MLKKIFFFVFLLQGICGAIAMEKIGATQAGAKDTKPTGVEGEAPAALLTEGATRAPIISKFEIFPDYLFTDEDLGVKFTAKVKSQGVEKKQNITLMEVVEATGKIKYRWPLNDDGKKGDEKSQDGVYSREIQFKEKRPKQIVFYVIEETEGLQGVASQSESLPAVTASQRAVLEIRAHPTFIDILKNVWNKIKEKF